MRKHRLYGVAIAVLLGTSLIDHRPSSPHHAAGTDIRRTGFRLAAAALPSYAQNTSTGRAAPATGGEPPRIGMLRPARAHFMTMVWTWVGYVNTHTPPPPPPPPPPHPAAPGPPAAVTPATAAAPAPARSATGDVWAGLRQCESGGDYAENTGNGYYGAYQFSLATWHGLGLPGLPSQASPAVQDQAAQQLQARSGWGQWPSCSRRLRLT